MVIIAFAPLPRGGRNRETAKQGRARTRIRNQRTRALSVCRLHEAALSVQEGPAVAMTTPTLAAVTRAAGEGPRVAGIDGHCASAYEADSCRGDSVCSPNEDEAPLRCPRGRATLIAA